MSFVTSRKILQRLFHNHHEVILECYHASKKEKMDCLSSRLAKWDPIFVTCQDVFRLEFDGVIALLDAACGLQKLYLSPERQDKNVSSCRTHLIIR